METFADQESGAKAGPEDIMTIAVIGTTGQLGRALMRAGGNDVCGFNRADLDLSKANAGDFILALPRTITGVVLAAAYTQVDKAQDQPEYAHRVNAAASHEIAQACAARGLPLIYISTDYVFGGDKPGAYTETDNPNPINLYGQSKRDGERAILAAGGPACILRTSWLFDEQGSNFLTTMLRLGNDNATLEIVGDQIGRPTYAPELARAALTVMNALRRRRKIAPIYHVAGSGNPVSWAQFAAYIFKQAGRSPAITVVTSAQYKTPARRPKNSVLDTSLYDRDFGSLPLWTDSASTAIKNYET